jgi:hypothetical protein
MNLAEIERRLDKRSLAEVVSRLDADYLGELIEIMKRSWRMMRATEKFGLADARYQNTKAVHFAAGIAAMQHLDHAGMTQLVRTNAKLLRHFSFVENFQNLSGDVFLLTNDLSIPVDKVKALFEHLDSHQKEVIKTLSSRSLSLERLARRCSKTCDLPGGPEWQYLSPGKWQHVVFVVGAAANGAAAAVTAGVALAGAWVSIALAVGGAATT